MQGSEERKQEAPSTLPPKAAPSEKKSLKSAADAIVVSQKINRTIRPRREEFDATRESMHRTMKTMSGGALNELDSMERKLAAFDTSDLTKFSKNVANLAKISSQDVDAMKR